jgi:hypothetical protein
MMTSDLDALGLIASYTRAQAIEDGQLVDVTAAARGVGIQCTVALTRAAHATYVAVPAGVQCQDEAGRLHDVLWMLRWAILRGVPADQQGTTLLFKLHVRNDNRAGTPRLVQLKAVIGPDDHGSGCLTILLPEED